MNKYPLIGGSICAVVLLVLGSMTSVVGYQSHTINRSHNEKSITIAVIESKADGTSKKSTVTLSQDQYQKLKEDLNAIKDPVGRFTVYQKYGLISKDMNAEKIRLRMEKRTLQSSIYKENRIIFHRCNVDVKGDTVLPPGLRRFLASIGLVVHSINLLLMYIEPIYLNVNGHDYSHEYIFAVEMLGFVGYTVRPYDSLAFESVGFCVLCFSQ